MKIIPLSLFFAGITLFSCSNESTNNLSTNSQKVKLNKNEVLSIAYDDAKELTDKDIFNMVSSFANMNAELPSIIAFIPNKGNDDAMQLSGANELLYAAKASYLYKAIKTKELVDSLKQPTLEKISKKLNIPINEINYQKIQDNIILTDTYSSRSTAVQGPPEGIQKYLL